MLYGWMSDFRTHCLHSQGFTKNLGIEATCSFETSVTAYPTSPRRISEDRNPRLFGKILVVCNKISVLHLAFCQKPFMFSHKSEKEFGPNLHSVPHRTVSKILQRENSETVTWHRPRILLSGGTNTIEWER
jgi:hypothetical protein